MKNIDLIKELLDIKRESSEKHTEYLANRRDYLHGDEFYMREAHLVIILDEEQPLTMSDLARRLKVTQGAVSQMVGRLEKNGYVYRQRSEKDKRSYFVYLTDKGKELSDTHKEYDSKKYKEISDELLAFTEEELKLFISYEKRLIKIFNEQ